MGKVHKLDMESLYIIHKRLVICTHRIRDKLSCGIG